jgi:hypothetical protein
MCWVRTDRRARRAGCFGVGLFQRRNPECRVLVPKLNEMQRNLGRLDRLRRQGGGGGGNPRRARQIQRALAAGDCTPSNRTDRQARREQEERLEQAARERRRERHAVLRGAPQARPRGGTFRTLCVRTCDGYYFPISFATTSDRFGDDAQACTNMCGGTEAELFVHPNPGGGPEDMVSVAGQAYSELPTAFAYRTNLNPSCSCKPSGGHFSIYGDVYRRQPGPAKQAESRSLCSARPPALGEDPETLANRSAVSRRKRPPTPPVIAGATSPDGRPCGQSGQRIGPPQNRKESC